MKLQGIVTLVQEDRFRLQDDQGRGYLFTLGRGNGVGLRKLHVWCEERSPIEVEYKGFPDFGAVALRLRERGKG